MKKHYVGLKELIVFCIIWVSSWCLSSYFRDIADENLLPLMEILIYFPFVIMILYITILSCQNLITILNTKSKNEIISQFIGIICGGIFLFIMLRSCILLGKDIIEEPKEITLFSVKMIEKSRNHYRNYYIKGVTSDNQQIILRFKAYRQSKKDVDELIENNIYLKINYFENSEFAYYVEKTEYEWELYKPHIDIIEVPNIHIKEVE